MLFVKWTLIGLILLPAAETVVFILVVLLFGWIWAILLFMGTTFAGSICSGEPGVAICTAFLPLSNLKVFGPFTSIHLGSAPYWAEFS